MAQTVYYEVVAANNPMLSSDKPPLIDSSIVDYLDEVPAAVKRLTALHLGKTGRMVFVRQYYADKRKGARFRVLHKLTVERTAEGVLRCRGTGVIQEESNATA